ncbi:MAG: metal-dependent hydrolase [Halobacteriales archaeon]
MPSTVVHVGFALLVATAVIGAGFDRRVAVVVAAFTVLPDIDTFLGLVLAGAHRAYLHNLVLPLVAVALLVWDARRRRYLGGRHGDGAYRVALVGVVVGWLVAGVALDGFYNGVNLLFPLHDEFIDLSGHLYLSDQRGVVQTFVNFDGFSVADGDTVGTTADTHYYTGVDPGPDAPDDAERVFPVFDTGTLAVVAVTGYAVAVYRLVTE